VLIKGATYASIFASLMVKRLRNKEQRRQKAALKEWEEKVDAWSTTDVTARNFR